MTAQRLRDTARGMREKAEGAHPGPWVLRGDERHPWVSLYEDEDSIPYDESLPSAEPGGTMTLADAAYIAAMHPVVAFAVADWLEREAESHVHIRGDGEPTFTYDLPGMDRSPALAVADAFLGQAEGATR